MAIKDWPDGEQPREKLLQRGPAALSDAELLAIFLRTGVRGKSAVDLARDLLERFGGLRPILEARREAFCATFGLGDAKYVHLQASLEIGRRHLESALRRDAPLKNPEETKRYLAARLRDHPCEVFGGLFLDNHHRIIQFDALFSGSVDSAQIHPRAVVRRALEHNAAAVIFAHNHPSGIAEPSRADEKMTARLRDALALIDVRVLDHIIIGDAHTTVSLAERGMI